MIRFKKIRYKNFLSTGNAFTEINLDKDTNTLIIGENGAGKSTLLDALCYVLFGTPFRKINIPTLVNSINDSDLLVEIEFIINSHQYLIRRGIKPVIFEIWKDGKLEPQTGAREYQQFLETQILHWNKKTLTQVAILGNANYMPFMQLTAADRRLVVEDILDIQIFSVMNKLLKARQNTISEKLVTNKHNCDITETELKLKTEHIEQMKQNKEKELEDIVVKIKETEDMVSVAQKKINDNNKQLAVYREKIAKKIDVIDKADKAKSNIRRIEDKKGEAIKQINFWNNTKNCPTCDSEISKKTATNKKKEHETALSDFDGALIKLYDMQEKFLNILKDIQEFEKTVVNLNNDNAKKLAEIRVLMSVQMDYEKKKKQLEDANADLDQENIKLAEIESRLVELKKEKDKLNEESVYMDVTADLLKDSGIKTRIIKQYLPIANKLINKHLAAMDFFVNFELDESFKETIKSRYRDEFSYENFSEGEKQRIDMAQMLAWREIAKLKNSAATNILVLDEIFDSSLDAAGIEFLMGIIQSLEKCNVFVISHKGDILQDKFQNVIKFQKQGNYSRIA